MNEKPCQYEAVIERMEQNVREIKIALLGDMKSGTREKAGLMHRTSILEGWKSNVNKVLGTFATIIVGGFITWIVTR